MLKSHGDNKNILGGTMKKNLTSFFICVCLPGLVCAVAATMMIAEEDTDRRGRGVYGAPHEDAKGTYYQGPSSSKDFWGTAFSSEALGFVATIKKKKKKIKLDPEIRDRSSSTGSSSGSNSSSDSE